MQRIYYCSVLFLSFLFISFFYLFLSPFRLSLQTPPSTSFKSLLVNFSSPLLFSDTILFFTLYYLYFTVFSPSIPPFSPLLSDPATSSQPLSIHTNVTRAPSPTVVSTRVTSIRYSWDVNSYVLCICTCVDVFLTYLNNTYLCLLYPCRIYVVVLQPTGCLYCMKTI